MIITNPYNQNVSTPKKMDKPSQLLGFSLIPPLVFVFVKGALSVGPPRAAVDVDVVCDPVVFSGKKIVEVDIERPLGLVVRCVELLAPPATIDELLPVLVAEEELCLSVDELVEPPVELPVHVGVTVDVGPDTVVVCPTVIGYIS